MLDNFVVLGGQVSDIRFNRLGTQGVSHATLMLKVPADGKAAPVSVRSVFYGRMAQMVYEMLEQQDQVLVNGWLQVRRGNDGSVLELVGERFRCLNQAEGVNRVVLVGQVQGMPYFGRHQGNSYLRLQLLVRRPTFPQRGSSEADLIRVVMQGELASRMGPQVAPGTIVYVQGTYYCRYRKGKPMPEVRVSEATPFSLEKKDATGNGA